MPDSAYEPRTLSSESARNELGVTLQRQRRFVAAQNGCPLV